MITASQRCGFTTTETVVVFVLLGVIVTSVGKFAAFASQGVRDRQLALHLQWELDNAREIIRTWPIEEVTRERIELLAISSELEAQGLEDPRWVAKLTPQLLTQGAISAEPSPSQQDEVGQVEVTSVQLQLNGVYRGQSIKPVETVFWILPSMKTLSTGDSSLQPLPAGEEVVP